MSDTFFQRFDEWVAAFDDVAFVEGESDEHHTQRVVTLLTKLVFVQTLADYGVVDADWLQKTWNEHERSHGHDGRHAVLDAFFTDVSEQVEAYCDVDLFTRDVYPAGGQSVPGAETVAQNVAAVVGVATDESQGEKTGVADVDFTQLDEDVFGRIYETYLADGRTGHGIYYTPGYVSRSLVADTVGVELGTIATRFEDAVETGRWDAAAAAAKEFTEFTVLDPACGTGSFLVAAFDTIRDEYDRLFECLDTARHPRRQSEGAETSENPSEGKIERIEALMRTLGYTEDERGELRLREREFAATLVLRHVHAVDLDSQALEIAKLNVWLAAVGRDPEFDSGVETDRRPGTTESGAMSTGGCDWPEFEVNFGCGDALVGLPDERVQDVLHAQYETEMRAIAHARVVALDDPRERASLRRAVDARSQIRPELDAMFEASVEDSQASTALLDETTPFYWPLQFWHVYQDSGGFDCVVGNPPWVTHGGEHTTRFLAERYEYQSGQPDLYRYFLERSLTATNGCMGLVTPNTWLSIPGARDLRRVLLRTARLTKIAFVPESAFTGVGQNSIAVVVDKQGPSTVAESSDDDFDRGGITVGELTTDGEFQQVRTVPPASIEPPAYHVNPYVGAEEYAITAKMTANATTLADIADLTVGYQLYHRSIHTPAEIENEVFHSEESDHDAHVPDTRAASLGRFHLDSSPTQYVDTSAEFFRIPPKRFLDGEKVLLREVPSKRETGLIAARSTTTRLFPKSVISVVLTDDDYDYQHLLGVLNSRVAYLQSLVTGEKMGQHLFPRVSLTQLRGLAIEGTTELTPLVGRLEALSARRFHFRQAWERRVEEQTITDRTLAAILGADHSAGDTEEATEAWVVDCSVDPDGDSDVLEREYSTFEFVGDTDRPSGVLYGIDDGVETAVLSVEFRTREQLQLVSLSVAALLDSRVNVDHLRHVLEKTVVRGAGEASVEPAVTLVRDVQRDVSDAVGSDVDSDEKPTDIVRIEAALSDAQMELDAAVFDLYGLTPADARTVLDVLGVREMVAEETVSRLTRLQTAARDG